VPCSRLRAGKVTPGLATLLRGSVRASGLAGSAGLTDGVNPWKVSLLRLTLLTLADNTANELDHESDDLVL
jgi:hypothetical protein